MDVKNTNFPRLALAGFLAFFLLVHASVLGGTAPAPGLTLITPGFQIEGIIGNDDIPQWAVSMAIAIRDQQGGNTPIYSARYVTNPAPSTIGTVHMGEKFNPSTRRMERTTESDIDIVSTGSAIVLLNWTFVSDEAANYSTTEIADSFFTFVFSRPHKGFPLVAVPIHLIGHSRGASLNSRLLEILATNGATVDQVTSLDPHPVKLNGSDHPVVTYWNAVFADNYWRTGLEPVGQSVDGAWQLKLDAEFTNAGTPKPTFVFEHQAVHTFYYATINTSPAALDDGDGALILEYPWFSAFGNSRDSIGFAFSRINHSVNRPVEGLNYLLEGADGRGQRSYFQSPNQLWPNVVIIQSVGLPSSVRVGQQVSLPYYYASENSDVTITASLDSDTNPFIGATKTIASETMAKRPGGVFAASKSLKWLPTQADVGGTYFVRLRASNSLGYERFDYFLTPITVLGPLPGKTYAITPSQGPNGSISPAAAFTANAGDSKTFTATPIAGYAVDTWSVNGFAMQTGQNTFTLSNIQADQIVRVTFKTSTSGSASGSLVVNLLPSNLNGAQWKVDSDIYRNSGDVITSISTGTHTVSFKPVSGYATPQNQAVTIVASSQTTITGTYSAETPANYTLTLNQGNGGVISVTPLGTANGNVYNYPAGTLVQLFATADSGNHFVAWSGEAAGQGNPASLTMNGSKTVSATFAMGDPNLGSVNVIISPPAAAAAGIKWGVVNDIRRETGSVLMTSPGVYFLKIYGVDGWIGPKEVVATIKAGQSQTLPVEFVKDTTPALLTVALSPPEIANLGAKWHVNGATYGNSSTVPLPAGDYTVTFDLVAGWSKPKDEPISQPSHGGMS